MKKLCMEKLIDTVLTLRKSRGITQQKLSEMTGINRTMIGHLENNEYVPSIAQLEALAEALDFDITDLFVDCQGD